MPGTALDRDVYISVAQVAIVLCVFCFGLYLNCVRMPATLSSMFFSAGRITRAALTAFYSGGKKNITLRLKYRRDAWILEKGDHKQADTIAGEIPVVLGTAKYLH